MNGNLFWVDFVNYISCLVSEWLNENFHVYPQCGGIFQGRKWMYLEGEGEKKYHHRNHERENNMGGIMGYHRVDDQRERNVKR